mgnify:CR=1 FL=1
MPSIGDMAPDFTLTAQDKSSVSLSEMRGSRVILAFYPAAFTGVCTNEMCAFSDGMASLESSGARVLGISVDSPGAEDMIKSFLNENSVTYDIGLDPSMTSTDVFSVVGLPASFLIGRDGTILYNRIGPIAEKDPDFESALEQAFELE